MLNRERKGDDEGSGVLACRLGRWYVAQRYGGHARRAMTINQLYPDLSRDLVGVSR
jgi:hypothetical protein